MDPKVAILTTLVLYKIVLLGIGFYASRKTVDQTDLYLGGRQMGPLVAAISASASSSSVWTLLGVSGMAFEFGLPALWLLPACIGGFTVNWFVLAPRLRSHSAATGALTLTEVLAGPSHHPGRRKIIWVASLITIACMLVYVAAQLNGASKSFESTLDMNPVPAILIGGVIIMVYMMLGGFWAVSLTDTLQGILMALTAILLPVAALIQVGGPAAMFEGLGRYSEQHPEYLSLTKGLPLWGSLGFVLGLMGILPGYPGQPHVINRFMALRDDQAVRRARVYAMTWAGIVYVGMIVLGLCGRLLIGETAASYDSEQMFFDLSQQLFPPLVTGVMLAAVLSAIMSTADSQLLAASASISHDIGLGKNTKGILSDRLVILVLCSVAMLMAIVGDKAIFDQVLSAWTGLGAAFAPLLLWTLFLGRVSSTVAVATMIAGFGTSVLGHVGSKEFHWFNMYGFERNFLPHVAAISVLILGSLRRVPPEDTQN